MTLGERIKFSRKQAGFTQQKLADAISIAQSTVAGYENDTKLPSTRSYSDIATACHVDEHWLRTGEGDPEPQLTAYEEITAFVEEALAGKPDDIKQRFLLALSRLDVEGWQAIATLAEKLSQK